MIMMGLRCINVYRRGETKETGINLFIDGNVEKNKSKREKNVCKW
jgi:hypothetical protein